MHGIVRMTHPVLLPVPGIPLSPAPLALPLVGLILRVSPHLFPLPTGLTGTLALLPATISLVLYTRVRDKMTPTVGTSICAAYGSLLMETINLQGIMPQSRIIWCACHLDLFCFWFLFFLAFLTVGQIGEHKHLL